MNQKKETIVFHFNKMHNVDPETIPPWVVKCRGQTFYVHHMEFAKGVGFSTKETPDNEHTKAALKVRGFLTIRTVDTGEVFAYVSPNYEGVQ